MHGFREIDLVRTCKAFDTRILEPTRFRSEPAEVGLEKCIELFNQMRSERVADGSSVKVFRAQYTFIPPASHHSTSQFERVPNGATPPWKFPLNGIEPATDAPVELQVDLDKTA